MQESRQDSLSHSIGDSLRSSFNESNRTNRTEEMNYASDSNYNNNIKSDYQEDLHINKDFYDVNYGLGSLDSFIKLKSTAKNIPTYKLLALLEKEAEYAKNILAEGKKERRIMESKLITSENESIKCAQNLVTKVVCDLDSFKKDMRSMIKQNMDFTSNISNELYNLKMEYKQLMKSYDIVVDLVNEGEEKVGIIDYYTGYD